MDILFVSQSLALKCFLVALVDFILVQDEDIDNEITSTVNDCTVPKFDRSVNKGLKEQECLADDDDDMGDLDEFMNLIACEDLERGAFEQGKNQLEKTIATTKTSSAKESKTKSQEVQSSEPVIKETNTGIMLSKSNFNSGVEIQSRLTSSYGKFYKISELYRFMSHLKTNSDESWYTIGILGTKSDTKCSAKGEVISFASNENQKKKFLTSGNNYMIWQMHDLNNLEHEHEVSLFLFGNSYKSHWKTSVYDVFAIIKPDFLDDYKNSNQSSGSSNKYFAEGRTNVKMGGYQQTKKPTKNKTTLSIRNDTQLVHLGFYFCVISSKNFFKTCFFFFRLRFCQRHKLVPVFQASEYWRCTKSRIIATLQEPGQLERDQVLHLPLQAVEQVVWLR